MTDLISAVDEELRLSALKRYEILDTPPEAAFDRLARLASLALGTPIALVSLIDRDRQWFKARLGLDISETPRDQAFCAHAILDKRQPLVVMDASREERFRDNPLVTGKPGIRFYVGAPIITRDGQALGTVCAIDREPREQVEPRDLETLQTLAAIAADEMELRFALQAAEKEIRLREAAQAETLLAEQAKARAEAEMLRLRGSETLSRVAGGVAHEFNNLFAGLLLSAEMLEQDPAVNDQMRADLRGIVKGVERGARLTNSLVSYSRMQLLRQASVDIRDSLITAAEILIVSRARDMDVTVDAASDLWPVLADPSKLLAALVDLAVNAWEATRPGFANVTFAARNVRLTEAEAAKMDGGRAGDFVRVDVRDSGRGMSADVLRHAVEPFFTTKKVGDGPGLGLSIVYGFAHQSGGFMWIDSREGTGTIVSLYLPREEAKA